MTKTPKAASGDISVAATAAVGQVEIGVTPHAEAQVEALDEPEFDDDPSLVDLFVRSPRLRPIGPAPAVELVASPDPVPLIAPDPPFEPPPFVPTDPDTFPEHPPPINEIPVVPPELAPPLEPPPPPPEPLPDPLPPEQLLEE
jgi:hypothetical protein